MMTILFASRNPDKLREVEQKVADLDVRILSPSDFPNLPDIVEDENTLEGNAAKKALALYKLTGFDTIADDTGLEVDALDGRPGVYSARYAGVGATYQDNVNKLLTELSGIPENERGAVFRTVIAYVQGGDLHLFEGEVCGEITEKQMGENGFGYDPVFFLPEEGKTFAELSLDQKNSCSHRGRALDEWVKYLKKRVF